MSVEVGAAVGWSREQMAGRAAEDIPDGSYVNLGIGIPELVAKFVPEGREFIYHTENGLLGMGPPPTPGTASSTNCPAANASGRVGRMVNVLIEGVSTWIRSTTAGIGM